MPGSFYLHRANSYQPARKRSVTVSSQGFKKKDPQIYYHTQTHPEFCSRFRIGVTNMFRAAVAISATLGSVVSVLRCQTVLLLSPL